MTFGFGSGGGGRVPLGTFSVATAGDDFIAVDLSSFAFEDFDLLVEGTPSADGLPYIQISDDAAVTFEAGAGGYSHQTALSANAMNIANSSVNGGDFLRAELSMHGFNKTGGVPGILGRTCAVNAAASALLAASVIGKINGLTPGVYNGFQVKISAGNLDAVTLTLWGR